MSMADIRYQLAPQMRIYDQLQQVWLPYLMFSQMPNFQSEVVSTDVRGLRISPQYDNVNHISPNTPINFLTGGSTAFGVGASSDKNTISAILSNNLQNYWLNYGGRAYSSTQELMSFLFYSNYWKNIKNVVIFSGVNNMVLYYISRYYPELLGSFYFSNFYYEKMNDLKRKNSFVKFLRTAAKTLLKPFYPELDYENISIQTLFEILMGNVELGKQNQIQKNHGIIHRKDINMFYEVTERDLLLWRSFGKAHNFKVHFVLQPFFNWTTKEPSIEEKKLFEALDKSQQQHWQTIKNYIDNPMAYKEYKDRLQTICQSFDISFLDTNTFFDASLNNSFLFVDRVHLNDAGNELIADIITKNLNL